MWLILSNWEKKMMSIMSPNKSCGAKGSRDSSPFHIKPKAHAEEEKCPRTNKGNPDCQDILPRTTLFAVDQNTEGEGATSLEAVPSRIPKEISSPMGQP